MRLSISLLLLQLFALGDAFNILYLVPFPAPSHWFWLKNFSEELLKRGHHVTVVTNYKRPEPHPNYTEVIINPPYDVMADFPAADFFSMKYDSVLANLYLTWDVGLKSTEHAFNDKNVAKFMKRTNLKFDVVVLEQFFHDSWLPFAKRFNAPLVTIATLGHADYFDNAMGLLTPSYVPHHVLTYTDNMNFVERSVNLFWRLADAFLRKFYYMAKMQEMADRHFQDVFNGTVPSIIELEKNVSFRIINTHQSMQFARPKMPGLTYVAGIHIKPPKSLPPDVQRLPISLLLLQWIALANSYNILYLCPFPAPSHWFWLKNFAEELLKRGHHVTAITNFKRPEAHANYTEVLIDPPYDDTVDFPLAEFFSSKYDSVLENLYLLWDEGLKSTEYAFRDKNVAAFMKRNDLQFDVVIIEQFFHDSWLPFAKKFNAPLITIATMAHADYFDSAMGLLTPSYVPHQALTYTDNMNSVERSVNFFWRITDAFLRKFYYMAKMQEMADRYFADDFNGKVPSILELESNISLRIINTHQSMEFARPKMPGIVQVAGIHIKPAKPLPSDVQRFLDSGSEHGVIYFSLGSCINSADLPPEKLQTFVETFRLLKQKVLWKFEGDTIPNMPPNLMIRKWLPQNDVLAHKNIILFLTHGGIFGTQESIHWAVPMVFIPVYSDQFRNARRCVDAGIAEMVRLREVSVKSLTEKLNN